MSLPSYEEFRLALADPARRSQIGLVIADSDAQSLAGNEEWARNYYDSWIALAGPAAAAAAPAAPADPFASAAPAAAPTEQFASAPSAPGGYAPAGYAAAPNGAQSPQNGYQNTGSSLPAGGAPKKKGLPGWALGVIIGGAALLLIVIVAIALIVPNILGGIEDANNASSNSQSDDSGDDQSGGDPTAAPEDEETLPETETPAFPGEEYTPTYSDDEAAAFLVVAKPLFGVEIADSEYMDDIVLSSGESVCLALSFGATPEEISGPMASDGGLDAASAEALVAASQEYLCP